MVVWHLTINVIAHELALALADAGARGLRGIYVMGAI